MGFKDEFLNELIRRLKENTKIIESSFNLAGIEYDKNKLLNLELINFKLPILVEDNPYIFLNKLVYAIVNYQDIKVTQSNIACDLLLELINLILDEFKLERIEQIGK